MSACIVIGNHTPCFNCHYRIDMVQIPGKRTQFVPVLILPPVRQSMDILVRVRTEMNLVPENEYFFASDSSHGNLSSYKVLRHCTQDAHLRFPTRVGSTNLRKYMATVTQVSFRTFSVCECNLLELM